MVIVRIYLSMAAYSIHVNTYNVEIAIIFLCAREQLQTLLNCAFTIELATTKFLCKTCCRKKFPDGL